MGVLLRSGVLWSDLTLAENVVVPLQIYMGLAPQEIQELVELKLAPTGQGPACSGAGIPETGREQRMKTPSLPPGGALRHPARDTQSEGR